MHNEPTINETSPTIMSDFAVHMYEEAERLFKAHLWGMTIHQSGCIIGFVDADSDDDTHLFLRHVEPVIQKKMCGLFYNPKTNEMVIFWHGQPPEYFDQLAEQDTPFAYMNRKGEPKSVTIANRQVED